MEQGGAELGEITVEDCPRRKPRRRTVVIAIITAAAVVGLAWRLLRVHEPVWQGKTLTCWLQQYVDDPVSGTDSKTEAIFAIYQIGSTNALPRLLSLISEREHPRKIQAVLRDGPIPWLAAKLGLRSKYDKYVMRGYVEKPYSDRKLAVAGFQLIGPPARPAIPDLIHLLGQGDDEVRRSAAQALWCVAGHDEEVQSVFRNHALSDPDSRVRRECTGFWQLNLADQRLPHNSFVEQQK